MPAYNHAKYIGKCIESVLSQDFHDWEMLIVDDGSTDNTYEIAMKYASNDPRIRFLRRKIWAYLIWCKL
ncbi:MAG: glycosyltransferase family 2 protein [Saprospiraceae bacterium]|nr:glycosyltransferase family 2 protein [Saprospiraceae bacterium]